MTTFTIILLIIISLSFVFLWIALCYFITLFFARLIGGLLKINRKANKKMIFLLAFLLGASSLLFLLFSSPATNYKTAYIQQYESGYKLMLKGKKTGMAHDPISAIFRTTYEDSIFFLLPRHSGVIQATEILVFEERFKPTGTITISGDKMVVHLFYDSQQIDPNSLEWVL